MRMLQINNDLLGTDLLLHDDIDEDPMGGMGNLMDVMLVFACGLIIALITHYNVDFSSAAALEQETCKVPVDIEQVSQSNTDATDSLTEIGTVYKDPTTGEIFIASDENLNLTK